NERVLAALNAAFQSEAGAAPEVAAYRRAAGRLAAARTEHGRLEAEIRSPERTLMGMIAGGGAAEEIGRGRRGVEAARRRAGDADAGVQAVAGQAAAAQAAARQAVAGCWDRLLAQAKKAADEDYAKLCAECPHQWFTAVAAAAYLRQYGFPSGPPAGQDID